MKALTFKDLVMLFDELRKTHSIEEIMGMPINKCISKESKGISID